MAEADRRIEELRAAWHKATEKDKPQDALKALVELERVQPSEPQWSQRLGEAHRRGGNKKEAIEAFVRAFERYAARGFLPRAIAMAKLVGSMDADRGHALEKSLAASHAPKAPAAPTITNAPKAPAAPQVGKAGPAPLAPRVLAPPIALKPVMPIPLSPAPDRAPDEVRFSDSQDASISVLLEDFSESTVVDSSDLELVDDDDDDDDLPPTESAGAQVLAKKFDAYGKMATFRLFAALSKDALVDLSAAADLVEFVPGAMVIVRDEKAFALFAIVSGTARVIVAGNPEIRLKEGDIFGESSLLDEGQRQADVKAETPLMCLRIEKNKLEAVMAKHPEVEAALFDLLARRLVTNLMHTSPLFAAFDMQGRLELAQRFEVRRASAGTAIAEKGRRSDGLYVILAGNVMSESDARSAETESFRIARGTAFGHASLMGGKSDVTIRAATEAVLLRMPASGFASLAAQYPPVLAYLSETANEPLPMSKR